MASDSYYAQRDICFGCDREWTYRESIPIEIAGLLFHNDERWLRWHAMGPHRASRRRWRTWRRDRG